MISSYYGTLADAEDYFSKRLGSQSWTSATNNDREAALFMATRAIDRLNFANEKTDADQELQFPRGEDTDVPDEVEYAAYECALKYLDGVDMDLEARNIGLAASSFGGVRSTFKEEFYPQHLRAGIPSVEAWYYLLPFLRNSGEILISRVS